MPKFDFCFHFFMIYQLLCVFFTLVFSSSSYLIRFLVSNHMDWKSVLYPLRETKKKLEEHDQK